MDAKRNESDVIDFYAGDIDPKFTRNELFRDALNFLELEGFICALKYEGPIRESVYSPREIKLTEKGKQYLKQLTQVA